jgi:hypothetical protein
MRTIIKKSALFAASRRERQPRGHVLAADA